MATAYGDVGRKSMKLFRSKISPRAGSSCGKRAAPIVTPQAPQQKGKKSK